MVTAGFSVTRILLPLFVAGGFAAIITLACSYQSAPEADRKKSDLMQMADDMGADRQNSRARTSAQRVAYVNALMDSAQSNASLRSVGEGLMSWARP